MDFSNYHFFDIDLVSLNLFSFMLGALWAFFNQGLFGRKIAGPIFFYFICLAGWYGLQYYLLLERTNKTPTPTEQTEPQRLPLEKKEVVGENGVRWTSSSTIPPSWNITEGEVDKLLGKLQSNKRAQNDQHNQQN